MQAPQPIDWPALLADIAHQLGEPTEDGRGRIAAGSRTLADYLQVTRSMVRSWQDGSEPRHCDGELVLNAWCRLTSKPAAFAPRTRAILSATKVR